MAQHSEVMEACDTIIYSSVLYTTACVQTLFQETLKTLIAGNGILGQHFSVIQSLFIFYEPDALYQAGLRSKNQAAHCYGRGMEQCQQKQQERDSAENQTCQNKKKSKQKAPYGKRSLPLHSVFLICVLACISLCCLLRDAAHTRQSLPLLSTQQAATIIPPLSTQRPQ